MTAEPSTIWRSPPTGGQHVSSGRKRPSLAHFPPADAPGARRFRLTLLLFEQGGAVHPATEDEEWRGLRSAERRPLDRDTATNARIRSGCPAQRSPAVIRRPEPRHVLESPTRPSASICVICGFLRWVGRSVFICVICGQIAMGGWLCALSVSLCLCGCSGDSWSWFLHLFVFATSWDGKSFGISHSSFCFPPCASPPVALSSSV